VNLVEILLAAYAALGLLLLAAWRGPAMGLWRATALLGLVLVAAALILSTHRLAAAPMIGSALIVVLLAALRARRAPGQPIGRRGVLRSVGRWMAAIVLLLLVVLDAAFIEILDPLSNDPVRELLAESHSLDLSRLPWPEAFEKLSERLSHAYAMTEWKRIDWTALHDRAAPRIAQAAQSGDRAAYYRALREYLWSVPDGHFGLDGNDGGLRHAAIQGGFGLALLRLDDGSTIAHVVTEHGPAAKAGMRWGAKILTWNGVPIDDAVERVSMLWSPNPPATHEGMRLARLKWLARAPLGSQAVISFQNLDETAARTATLEALDDQFAPVRAAAPRSENFTLRSPNVTWRVLPGGVGYLKVRAEFPTLSQLLPERIVRQAVDGFSRAGVRAVILDARSNIGGADKLVPLIMGWFVGERQFYEQVTLYDDETRRFEIVPSATLWTEPRQPVFSGPLAVLVDEHCASSGEGLALIARRRPNGHVVGFYGTYGSFGVSGAEILMPGGLTIEYASGQSLDRDGVIQLDSDWSLEGGVTPDARVPLTLETARAEFQQGRDVVLETALDLLK